MTRVPAAGPGARNLLGLDVLRRHSCLLDVDRKLLTLDAQPDPVTFGSLMPLYLDDVGHAYIDVIIGGDSMSAVWDTGAGITVVDCTLVERHPDLFEKVAPTDGTDAAGNSQQTLTYRMAPVTIGGVSLAEQKVAAVDLSAANATLDRPMDVILGYPALRQAIWFIDFPRRRWALRRIPG